VHIRPQIRARNGKWFTIEGADPGCRDMITAYNLHKPPTVVHQPPPLSRGYYSHMSRFNAARGKRKAWLRKAPEVKAAQEQLTQHSFKVSSLERFVAANKARQELLPTLFPFYQHHRNNVINFRSFRKKVAVMDQYINKLLGPADGSIKVVAFGAAQFRTSAPGFAGAPMKYFARRLARRCIVVYVDEFRTSKLCTWCGAENLKAKLRPSGTPKGTLVECFKVFMCRNHSKYQYTQRDTNAARNMGLIMESYLSHHCRPERFCRQSVMTHMEEVLPHNWTPLPTLY